MTKRQNIILLVLTLISTAVFGQNGKIKTLSLQEALEIAKQKSYGNKIARSQVENAKGQNLESWSGFLPHVSITENYLKSNDPVNVFMMKLKQGVFTQEDFVISSLNDPDDLDNFTTSFQVQQPILNFDAIYGKSAAGLGVKASKEAAKRAEETIALHVRKAYFGLILARENLKALDEAVKSAETHRDNARAAFEEGIINQADYLGAEVRLSELQEQRISAEHQIANASDALKFVMGLEDDSTIVPTENLETSTISEKEFKLSDLTSTRSDLRAMGLQQRAAARSLWMKRSAWLPKLNAFGAIEWNATDAFKKDASSWAFGLQLQWNIFQGFGNFGRTKQAAAQKRQAETRYHEAEEKAKMESKKAKRAVKAARERIRVAESAVKQAEESLRIVEARFKQGLEKTSDVLDKEVMLTNSKLRLLKAKHDFKVAQSELDYALGV